MKKIETEYANYKTIEYKGVEGKLIIMLVGTIAILVSSYFISRTFGYAVHESMLVSLITLLVVLVMAVLVIMCFVLAFGKTDDGDDKHCQAVKIIDGYRKGYIGYIVEIGHFYPDAWTRHSGYDVRINAYDCPIDENCFSCYDGWVHYHHVTPCLCKKCGLPLFSDLGDDTFVCSKCKKKVKILAYEEKTIKEEKR